MGVILTTLTHDELARMFNYATDAERDAAERHDREVADHMRRLRMDCAKMAIIRKAPVGWDYV